MGKHVGTFLGITDKDGREVHCAHSQCPTPDRCRSGCADRIAILPRFGFDFALRLIKQGKRVRRDGWKPARYIMLREAEPERGSLLVNDGTGYQPPTMSYIELRDCRGASAPWTPTRCDLLEEDWVLWPK